MFLANGRVATRATQLAGYHIDAGDRLYLNWTSANRDESVFGDPDAYRPVADAPHNLGDGAGIHVSLGRPLATMELVVVTEELLAATSRIGLDPADPPVRETYAVVGWSRVPVTLVSRQAGRCLG